jgi:outer membrane receptor protein involved in Fe transport
LPSVFTIDTNQNTGTARIEGFDLSARYALDMQQWGRLDVGANAVVFTKNDLKSLPDHEYYNISGLNFAE